MAASTSVPRRRFLLKGLGLGVAGAGALVLGWGVLPPRQRLNGSVPLPVRDGAVALNGWLAIRPDGRVMLAMPRSEMGQGVHTALAMLVAEELDVPLASITLMQAPVDKIFGNLAMLADGLPFHPDDQGALKRLAQWTVIKAARDLGITTPIPNEATIGLGTAEVSLLELTAAYAAIANGQYPVRPRGLEETGDNKSWYESLTGGTTKMPDDIREKMLDLLSSSLRGTGREAVLSTDAYGKTGTSQQSRDAWFIGFAGDLVVGVWVGNDDSSPNPGLHGGGVPAQIWRNFMVSALGLAPPQAPVVVEENASDPETIVGPEDPVGDMIDQAGPEVEGTLDGLGLQMKMGRDGSISITPGRDREPDAPREPREPRARGDEGGERE